VNERAQQLSVDRVVFFDALEYERLELVEYLDRVRVLVIQFKLAGLRIPNELCSLKVKKKHGGNALEDLQPILDEYVQLHKVDAIATATLSDTLLVNGLIKAGFENFQALERHVVVGDFALFRWRRKQVVVEHTSVSRHRGEKDKRAVKKELQEELTVRLVVLVLLVEDAQKQSICGNQIGEGDTDDIGHKEHCCEDH
jgi:hypothetical protein